MIMLLQWTPVRPLLCLIAMLYRGVGVRILIVLIWIIEAPNATCLCRLKRVVQVLKQVPIRWRSGQLGQLLGTGKLGNRANGPSETKRADLHICEAGVLKP